MCNAPLADFWGVMTWLDLMLNRLRIINLWCLTTYLEDRYSCLMATYFNVNPLFHLLQVECRCTLEGTSQMLYTFLQGWPLTLRLVFISFRVSQFPMNWQFRLSWELLRKDQKIMRCVLSIFLQILELIIAWCRHRCALKVTALTWSSAQPSSHWVWGETSKKGPTPCWPASCSIIWHECFDIWPLYVVDILFTIWVNTAACYSPSACRTPLCARVL